MFLNQLRSNIESSQKQQVQLFEIFRKKSIERIPDSSSPSLSGKQNREIFNSQDNISILNKKKENNSNLYQMNSSISNQNNLNINNVTSNLVNNNVINQNDSNVIEMYCSSVKKRHKEVTIKSPMQENQVQTLNNIYNPSKQVIPNFFLALKLKKYANFLVNRLQCRRYKNLKLRHLQFFNDKTIILNENLQLLGKLSDRKDGIIEYNITFAQKITKCLHNFYEKKFTSKLKHYIDKIFVFTPSNLYKLLWDFINMLFVLYFLIIIPLKITFGFPMYSFQFSFVGIIIIIFDNLIALNTGFYYKGALVSDRINILINYINQRFFYDVISILPFLVSLSEQTQIRFQNEFKIFENSRLAIQNFIYLLFFFRMSHLMKIKTKIEERFYQQKIIMHFLSLFSLLCSLLYIAHIFSCIWLITAQAQNSCSWIDDMYFQDKPWHTKYLYSLYYIIVTMTTVGYGDLKPNSDVEHVVIIVIILVSSFVFAFSLNQVGTIVSYIQEENEEIKQTLQVINNYMTKKNINMNLQQQIREYLEYYLRESIVNNSEVEDKVVEMLSEPLKRQLMIEANKIALKDSPIFSKNFSDNTISKTVSLIQEIRCTPEEIIFYEGNMDDCQIYFVLQGKVELFVDSYKSNGENEIHSLKLISKGQSFGEECFFTGFPRSHSIRSVDFSTLLIIKRQDFINVVKESQLDYENFCRIKDQILLYKSFKDSGIKCMSCSNEYHNINDCPFIHYVYDKDRIIRIHQRPEKQERMLVSSKIRRKYYKMWQNQEKIQLEAYNCYLDNEEFLEQQFWFENILQKQELFDQTQNDYDEDDEEENKIESKIEKKSEKEEKKIDRFNYEVFHKFDTNDIHEENPKIIALSFAEQKSDPTDNNTPKATPQSNKSLVKRESNIPNQIIDSFSEYQNTLQNPQLLNNIRHKTLSASHLNQSQNSVDVGKSLDDSINIRSQKKTDSRRKSTKSQRSRALSQQKLAKISINNNLIERNNRKRQSTIQNSRKRNIDENQIQNTLLTLQDVEKMLIQKKNYELNIEFEIMKSFQIYFPYNNLDVVLFKIRKKNPHLYAKNRTVVKKISKRMGKQQLTQARMSKMDLLLQKFQNTPEQQENEFPSQLKAMYTSKKQDMTKNIQQQLEEQSAFQQKKTIKISFDNNENNILK